MLRKICIRLSDEDTGELIVDVTRDINFDCEKSDTKTFGLDAVFRFVSIFKQQLQEHDHMCLEFHVTNKKEPLQFELF